MALLKTHQLAYDIERVLERKFRSLKFPRPKQTAEEIAPDIMREIPNEAFAPKEPWEYGHLFYSGDVDQHSAICISQDVLQTHLNLSISSTIHIQFNSVGGSVYDGLGIVSTIQEVQRAGREVHIHVQGVAMSMASVILQAGTVRTMEPHAFLMLHEEAYEIGGKMFEHRDALAFSERLDDACTSLYCARTGKPIEYYKKRFERRDWYLSAQEALEEGLVDDIKTAPIYKRIRRKRTA